MRRIGLAAVVACALGTSAVRADPGPPPDPSKGERSDGKIKDGRRLNELLVIPRILLAPPRMLLRGIAEPVRIVLSLDQKYHILKGALALLTSQDGKRGLRPGFRYISRFQPQLGVTYFDKKLLGEGSSLSMTVGAVLPALIFAEAAIHPRVPDPYRFGVEASYLRRDDVLFAGVGPASEGGLRPNSAPRGRVGVQWTDVDANLEIRLHRHVRVNLGESWSMRNYADGRNDEDDPNLAKAYCTPSVHQACVFPSVDAARVPGFYDGANFFTTRASLAVDTRPANYSARYWAHFDLQLRYMQSPRADGPAWFRGRAAVSGGIPIGGQTRQLVLRIAVDMLEPVIGGPVPFTELVTLGGPDDYRGAPIGRFRDYSSVIATLEYRWAIWMWADAVIFTDWAGTFGKHFQGFAFDKLLPDVGVGVQIHTTNHFLLRAQLAYGFGDGFQVLLATSTGL